MLLLQYGTFFATGKSWTEVMTPTISNILRHLAVPDPGLLPAGAVLDRKLFKVTRNPYLGGMIFALIMTIMACTNTLTLVP